MGGHTPCPLVDNDSKSLLQVKGEFIRLRGEDAGVALRDGDTLCADLVIDASGRQSKVGKWLEAGGYEAPRSVEVNPNICYYSTVFEAPQEVREPPTM